MELFLFAILLLVLLLSVLRTGKSGNEPDSHEYAKEPSFTQENTPEKTAARGTISERQIISVLLEYGIAPQAIFHDLYLARNNKQFSQIDVVVATQVGIIVFEVKDYSGWIYGNGKQNKWTEVLDYSNADYRFSPFYKRKKYRFYNPIMQNQTHISLLKRALNEDVPYYSVIVFYGSSKLQDISFVPENTFVTKDYRIYEVLQKILTEKAPANYKDKHNVVKVLKAAVANGDSILNKVAHTNNIKNLLGTERVFK